MERKYIFKTSPTQDGEVSEIFYDENAEKSFADDLQSKCNEFADDLQPNCNGIADDLQTSCNRIADNLQTKCSQPAIDKTPNKSFHRPTPLVVTDDIGEILKFLNDDKYIQDISKGLHQNIFTAMGGQMGLPSYVIDDLRKKGMTVDKKPINDANCRRQVVPLLLIQKKDKELKKVKKINLILFITLIFTLIIVFTKSPTYPTAQATNENKVIITDSVCTAAELHKYIVEYSKLTKKVIYPYSENIILERINQKQINSISGIKDEIETRLAELAKR